MTGDITLDLREGFQADALVLRAEGMDDLALEGVTTRLQIGRARSLALPGVITALDVELPRREVRARIALRPQRPLWVGISLARDGRRLEVIQQTEPFGYV